MMIKPLSCTSPHPSPVPRYLLGAEVHAFVHRHVEHELADGQGDGDVVRPAEAPPKYRAAVCEGERLRATPALPRGAGAAPQKKTMPLPPCPSPNLGSLCVPRCPHRRPPALLSSRPSALRLLFSGSALSSPSGREATFARELTRLLTVQNESKSSKVRFKFFPPYFYQLSDPSVEEGWSR